MRILALLELSYAEYLEGRRTLAVSTCGVVMLWGIPACADTAANFDSAGQSIDAIALAGEAAIECALS